MQYITFDFSPSIIRDIRNYIDKNKITRIKNKNKNIYKDKNYTKKLIRTKTKNKNSIAATNHILKPSINDAEFATIKKNQFWYVHL